MRETRAGCNHSSLKWLLVSAFYFWQLSKSLRHINAFEFINLSNCFSIDRTLVKVTFRLLTEESVFLFPHKYSGMFAASNQSHFGEDVKLTVSRSTVADLLQRSGGVQRLNDATDAHSYFLSPILLKYRCIISVFSTVCTSDSSFFFFLSLSGYFSCLLPLPF